MPKQKGPAGEIRPVVGQLEICGLCDSSPHTLGCPYHPHYNDERITYFRADAPDEVGPASYWVEDTFVLAALDSGMEEPQALREGLNEFQSALKRGELRRL